VGSATIETVDTQGHRLTRGSETFASSRHSLGFHRSLAGTCRYLVPREVPNGELLRSRLEVAVASVILTHASLRVGITGEKTATPQFLDVATIDLHDHIQWIDTACELQADSDFQLLRLLESEHDRLWPDVDHRPPWKVIVVKRPQTEDGRIVLEIIALLHHAIGDGKSAAVFHSTLLKELGRGLDQHPSLANHVLTLPTRAQLLPPQEQLVNFEISWGFLFRVLWANLAPAWLQGPPLPKAWTGKNITLDPYATRLRLVLIPASTIPSLLATCRENGVTFTSLINGLVLCSMSRRVALAAGQPFTAQNNISLRPFVEKGPHSEQIPEAMTNLHTALQINLDHTAISGFLESSPTTGKSSIEDRIWQVSKSARSDLKARLATLPKDDIVGLMHLAGDWQKSWPKKLGTPRGASWEISNIGTMAGTSSEQEDGPSGWSIERSILSQCASVAGAAVSVNVSGIKGGAVCMALSWQEDVVETSIIDGLAADLQNWFDHFGRTGNFGI
jgi:hypothetical protein